MSTNPFDAETQLLPARLVLGLSKIGLALKAQAWQEAGGRGLTPTQGQILALLRSRPKGLRLTEIAHELGVTLPTTSDAVSTLVQKRLVRKDRSPTDSRAVCVVLTEEGEAEGERAASWPDFLLEGVQALSPDEQEVFLRGLLKMIASLQESGRVPVQRMCITCKFFRPYVYASPEQPHHCSLVNAPFGGKSLRIDCPEQQPAEPELRRENLARYMAGEPKA